MDTKEIFKIREEIIETYKNKFSKYPTKKQFIMEVLNHQGGLISMQLLSNIMNYDISLLEKWVLKLSVEYEIKIEGDYKYDGDCRHMMILANDYRDDNIEVCKQDCKDCLDLIDEYDIINLEICEFCGHYFVQNKFSTGYCNLCDKGKKRGKDIMGNKNDYKNIKELRTIISNFDRGSSISGAESAVLNALSKLSDNYAWKVYLSIFKFIDSFLW